MRRPVLRIIFRALVLLTLFCSFSAWGKTEAKDKLTLYTEEFPPINYTKNGKLRGFAAEIVEEIQKRIGNTDQIKVVPWPLAYKETQEKPNTALFSMIRKPAREKKFKWVGPLVKYYWSFYARKGSGIKIRNLEDAKKVRWVGTVKDYSSEKYLKDKGFKNLMCSTSPVICARNLKDGWIDLLLMADPAMPYVAIQAGIEPGNFEKVYRGNELVCYIAFSLKTPDKIIKTWQKALDSMKEDGTYQRIEERWMSGMAFKQTKKKLSKQQISPRNGRLSIL
jgi:polar amino acid transport system substrate-binding protein